METLRAPWISLVLLASILFLSNPSTVVCRRTYIIQVQKPTTTLDEEGLKTWYKSLLPESDDNSDRLLHSYSEVFHGFAAKLDELEVESVAKKEGVLRAFPDRILPLRTTHSPDFLGLKQGEGLWKASRLGKGVIIGVLDTGYTPGHPSFDDAGLPPPPAKWKGSCDSDRGCNNKVIGAKNLITGSSGAPTDTEGHGTHTASTAAGNFVRNASFYGLDRGTAAGVAPLAHLAIYQVCGPEGCSVADVLAGLDMGVKDRVDVLSLSLGGESLALTEDPLAIGAFGAVQKGVFVSCAAGNDGPGRSTVSNEAPWILTVAASDMDRSLRATVKLGNGEEIPGESLDHSRAFGSKSYPLFHSTNDPSCESLYGGGPGGSDVEGKIAVCDIRSVTVESLASSVKILGGVGLIAVTPSLQGYVILERRCDFPTAIVSYNDGARIKSYATSPTANPKSSIIFNGTVLGASPAPVISFFSSRGPSLACPSLIKPDISGPGVNILAAWPSSVDGKRGKGVFNVISGTSMSTPHLSGVAALIKSVHPEWSPAAIKSAIMTTSDDKGRNGKKIVDEQHKPADFFTMGAGHVNPSKAADPGLVYDLGVNDYIAYLCGKYGDASAIVRDRTVDCAEVKNITEAELNYPSILLIADDAGEVTVSRKVTNVGPKSSRYEVEVEVPEKVEVTVEPQTLEFSEAGETKSFTVSAKWVNPPGRRAAVNGNLRWVSDEHVVRSPIVVVAAN